MFSKKILSLTLIAASLAFVACEEDDDETMDTPVTNNQNNTPSQTLTVSDQISNRNSIVVSEVKVDQAGWVVVHRDNGNNGPVVPAIISTPKALAAGTNTNVKVEIPNVSLTDGEKLWVMVHTDDGDGMYEFDTDQSVDGPVMVDGNVLMTDIELSSPKITANNQTIMNNQMVIERVEAAVDGWLVIHHYNNNPNDPQYLAGLSIEPIAGKVAVSAGVNTNLTINLSSDSTYSAGYKLYPMLHIDGDGNSTYDFPGGTSMDLPEIFSNNAFPGNVVLTEVTVQ